VVNPVVNLNYVCVCVMVECRLKHLCLMSILACLAFCVDAYGGCLFKNGYVQFKSFYFLHNHSSSLVLFL
jgi:hypothetical protein